MNGGSSDRRQWDLLSPDPASLYLLYPLLTEVQQEVEMNMS